MADEPQLLSTCRTTSLPAAPPSGWASFLLCPEGFHYNMGLLQPYSNCGWWPRSHASDTRASF